LTKTQETRKESTPRPFKAEARNLGNPKSPESGNPGCWETGKRALLVLEDKTLEGEYAVYPLTMAARKSKLREGGKHSVTPLNLLLKET
jgi:hypothetical protein